MVENGWSLGRLSRQYLTHNWSHSSDFDVCDHSWHICHLSCWSATPSPWLLAEWSASCLYRKQSNTCLWVCVLTCCAFLKYTFSHTKKNCQDDSNRNRSPVDLDQVYCIDPREPLCFRTRSEGMCEHNSVRLLLAYWPQMLVELSR